MLSINPNGNNANHRRWQPMTEYSSVRLLDEDVSIYDCVITMDFED